MTIHEISGLAPGAHGKKPTEKIPLPNRLYAKIKKPGVLSLAYLIFSEEGAVFLESTRWVLPC